MRIMIEFVRAIVVALAFFGAVASASGQYLQQGSKLVGTGATGAAYQGYSVAVSGDGQTALLGSYYDNSGVGAALVFTRVNGAWVQQGPKLVGAGNVGNSAQGSSVALSAKAMPIFLARARRAFI